jgi:ammonia channel protein AmtB
MPPGLAFFYGGLVGRKNVLAIMIQSFVSMGWTTVIWYAYGYSLCFSGDWHGVIGNLHYAFLRNISLTTSSPANDSIPLFVFIAYQMMFAIITPALISGAFTNRVTFKAYMLFLTGWLTLVYFPFVHMLWAAASCNSGASWTSPAASSSTTSPEWPPLPACFSLEGGVSLTADRTAFPWLRWAPAFCGSDGTASMPEASSAWMR